MDDLTVRVGVVDTATPVLKEIGVASGTAETKIKDMGNASAQTSQQFKQTTSSSKDLVVGFAGLATSAFALYNAVDNVMDMQVSLSRAHLQVKSTLNSLDDTQRRYTATVQKYGAASEEAKSAAADLALAQERYGVAVERADMIQGNFNETIVRSALSVVPIFITAASSISKISENWGALSKSASNVTTSFKNLGGSVQSLGIGIAGAIGAFLTIYTVLNSLPEGTRQLGAALAILIGVIVAVAVAAAVMWGSLSLGTAIPIILTAVGAAVAGVTVALTKAGVQTDELSSSTNTLTGKLDDLDSTFKDTTTTIEEGYKKQTQALDDAFNTQLGDMKSGYDDQRATVNAFYDDIISTTQDALDEIRGARSADLDDLELTYLLQKDVLQASLASGKMSQEQFDAEMESLDKTYRDNRSEISDAYRIKEIQAEKTHNENVKTAEEGRAEAIKTIKIDENFAIEKLTTELYIALQKAEDEKNAAILAAEVQHKQDVFVATKLANDAHLKATQENDQRMYEEVNSYWYKVTKGWNDFWNGVTNTYNAIVNPSPQPASGWNMTTTPNTNAPLPAGVPPNQPGRIPVMQEGGLVTRPIYALLGERGPEVVIPLHNMPRQGTSTQNITINPTINIANVSSEVDVALIAERTSTEIMNRLRRIQ